MVFRMFKRKDATPTLPPQPQSQVPSPCNGVCDMDWAAKLCKSCHRTVIEIGEWNQMDDAGKLEVLAELERRKASS